MARRKEIRTRSEVSERIQKTGNEMEEKESDLEIITSDVETVRGTLEKIGGGTKEGLEEVERSIEGAEDVTEQEFNREDENLERIQAEGQEFEGEIEEHQDSSESDRREISDASSKIETRETINELEKAEKAASRDIDFLAEQKDRARSAREKSDSVQEKLKARVHSGKRRR
jgi:chromosome segregation ATPase